MDEQTFKNLIPRFLDEDLQDAENKEFTEYLNAHPEMQAEIDAYKATWAMLEEADSIEPDPNYVSRFWTNVSNQKSFSEGFLTGLKNTFSDWRLTPVLASLCVVFLIGVLSIRNYYEIQKTDAVIATLNADELELVDDIELVENYDLIEDMEFFEDLEAIENYDPQQSFNYNSAFYA